MRSGGLLWHLLASSRGGANRLLLLRLLRGRPYNAHQLTQLTGLDYRTVRHHLGRLVEHRVVSCPRPDLYGALYFFEPWAVLELATIESATNGSPSEILARVHKKTVRSLPS